jgi:lipid II:glycine glycyltransferase (peptidoglycan interpeptide bridge formation enzyme)
MSELTLSQWNAFIQSHPDAHILQTGAWGELKSRFHWEPVRIASGDTGAQVLFRALPAGLTIAYIPRGPVGQKWDRLWPEIDAVCQKKHAIFLKIEPDVWDADIKTEEKWLPKGIHPSKSIQAAQTIIIDLTPSQEEIINKMKPKTRYNIRLAEKKGVEVRFSDDIPGFHKLMAVTGERNGFGIHNQAYFQAAYDLFQSDYSCKLLMAYFENQPIAGLMVYKQGKRAWYLYGASNELERNRMPTYLLQWKAMLWAKEEGCTEYDLWGIPDSEENVLEANFEKINTGLWGVYRFKRGFGGRIQRIANTYDRVYKPLLYRAYQVYSRIRSTGETA